jgi:hypothetical protein
MKQKEPKNYQVLVPLLIGIKDLRMQKAILYRMQNLFPEYDGHIEGLLNVIDAIEDECKEQGAKLTRLPKLQSI